MKDPDDKTPEEQRELWRDVARLYEEYRKAGSPFGMSSDALKIWFDYGCIGRRN